MARPDKRKDASEEKVVKRQKTEEVEDDDEAAMAIMRQMMEMSAQGDEGEDEDSLDFASLAEGDEGDNPMISSLLAMTKLTAIVDKELKAIGVDMDQEGELDFPEDFDKDAFCVRIASDSGASPLMVQSILEALQMTPPTMGGDEGDEDDEDTFDALLSENEDDEQ